MTSYFNTGSLYMNAMYGLQNAYTSSLQDGASSITRQDLLDNLQTSFLSGTTQFSSYMSTKFSNIDANQDGSIAAEEMQTMMNNMATQGLSYEELAAFSGNGSISSKDLSVIMQNFRKIDSNGDGRVSDAEINYFMANKEMEDKLAALKDKRISDMSIMYDLDADDYEG